MKELDEKPYAIIVPVANIDIMWLELVGLSLLRFVFFYLMYHILALHLFCTVTDELQ